MDYDPSSYEIQADPHPVYRWMREEAPLYRNERLDFWALTRFEDVLAGLVDHRTYSSAQGTLIEQGMGTGRGQAEGAEMMIFSDPPTHTRLRKLVSRAFTPRRVAELEPAIRELCAGWLDPLVARGGGDMVKDFAALLPMTVISMLLGIPEADRDRARRWSDGMLHRDPGSVDPPPSAMEAGANLYAYLTEQMEERRREPRDDMMTALVRAEIDDDGGGTRRLTDAQVVNFCLLLAVAGNETTTKLIGALTVALEEFRDQRELLLDDPGLVPGAVEEILRFDPPSHYQGRVNTRDVEWHGRHVPAGSRILFVNGAANRDDREFADPDRFDVRRDVERHLAFGQGIHHCLGAALARLETRVALEEMLRRMPGFEVDLEHLERMHSSNVRGLSGVPFACPTAAPSRVVEGA